MLSNRCLLGLILLFVAGVAGAAQTRVEAVRIGHQSDKTRVAIDLSRFAEYKLFTLSNPHRVVIDIQRGDIAPTALPLPTGRGAVHRVRSAKRQDGNLRIVLDLTAPMQPRSFVLGANGERGERLVIDLFPLASGAPVKTVPHVSAMSRGRGRDIVVVIDPGHGGKDPGARGPSGLREKDVVLKISRQLAEIINAQPGMRAYLTRGGDNFVRLRDRMERARTKEADLFISIHADSFRDRRVHGATVYVLSPKGAADEADRRLAKRENAALLEEADLIGGITFADMDKILAGVLIDLSQNAAMSSSIDVGDEILGEISRITKVRKGKVQQAPFLVLKSPDVPSVLVETAFISNPGDEKNLGSSRYRERLARAIFDGLEDYFNINPPPGTRLALARQNGTRLTTKSYVIRRGDTLSGIADRYNVSIRRIRSVNNLHSDRIKVGKVLQIPPTQEI